MLKTDPAAVGSFLAKRRRSAKKRPLSEIADTIPWHELPKYNAAHPTVEITTAQYRRDLEESADPHRKDMLRHITEGAPLEDDPSG